MKHIKNQNKLKLKNGFAMVEVIIAVALMATILTSIYTLQSSIFKAVSQKHSAIERIFKLRNLFFDYNLLDKFRESPADTILLDQEIKDPKMKINFAASSAATQEYPFLYNLNATGKWQGMYKQEEELVLGIVFAHIPPDASKDKTKDKTGKK